MAIKITKLILDKANQKIVVSAEVEKQGDYMTAIYIDTQKSFVCSNEPSSSASKIELNPKSISESTDTLTIQGGCVVKITDFEVDLATITAGVVSTLDIDKDILFLFIDNISQEDIAYTLRVVLEQKSFYNLIFKQIHKDIATVNCCDVPQSAADLALMFEAFQLSLLTKDFRRAVYYWNELHGGNNLSTTAKCNCR